MAEETRKLFNEWLAQHARGSLNAEATLAMADVVQAVSDAEKPGKLIVEITIAPTGAGGRAVAIGGKVTMKFPPKPPELSVFYVGESGGLYRDDPFQQRIPGVPVAAPAGEIKALPPDETEPVRLADEDQGEGHDA